MATVILGALDIVGLPAEVAAGAALAPQIACRRSCGNRR